MKVTIAFLVTLQLTAAFQFAHAKRSNLGVTSLRRSKISMTDDAQGGAAVLAAAPSIKGATLQCLPQHLTWQSLLWVAGFCLCLLVLLSLVMHLGLYGPRRPFVP